MPYIFAKERCEAAEKVSKRKEENMKTNGTAVSAQKRDTGKGGLHSVFLYVTQHWQLYVIFLLPALDRKSVV